MVHFSVFAIQKEFRKDAARLYSLLDQFNDNGANVGLVVIDIDKGIKLISCPDIITPDIKQVQMTGSIITVHVLKPIIVQGFLAFPVQKVFSAFIKNLDRNVILVKVVDHICFSYFLNYRLLGK